MYPADHSQSVPASGFTGFAVANSFMANTHFNGSLLLRWWLRLRLLHCAALDLLRLRPEVQNHSTTSIVGPKFHCPQMVASLDGRMNGLWSRLCNESITRCQRHGHRGRATHGAADWLLDYSPSRDRGSERVGSRSVQELMNGCDIDGLLWPWGKGAAECVFTKTSH